MRKLFAFALIAMLLGVGLVALIETEPGYMLITYGEYTVETSLWVGLALTLLLVLLFYGLVRLVHVLLAGPGSVANWFGERRARQAARHTSRGMINFIEGNWDKARSQMLKGAEGNEVPLLNYLVAARASHRLKQTERTEEYLVEAKLEEGRYEQALATLKRARKDAGRHPQVLPLLHRAYIGLGDWQGLGDLLPDLKKYMVLDGPELGELERRVVCERLSASAAQGSEALRQQWHQSAAEMKRDTAVVQHYAQLLLEQDGHDAAEKVLRRAQKQHWDSGLARLYGYVGSGAPDKQLATAEEWLKQHGGDPQLLLSLGRLASRCQLWGKARDYFERSYQAEPSAEACAELGRLLAAQGEERPAAAYFREGLDLEQSDLPDLPLPPRLEQRPLLEQS